MFFRPPAAAKPARFNPMRSMSRDELVAAVTAEVPPHPARMAGIVKANLRCPAPRAERAGA